MIRIRRPKALRAIRKSPIMQRDRVDVHTLQSFTIRRLQNSIEFSESMHAKLESQGRLNRREYSILNQCLPYFQGFTRNEKNRTQFVEEVENPR